MQDARSNLAVQPAANAGNVKLKKNAVKIVGAVGPTPNTQSRSAAPVPTMRPSPALPPVKAKPNEALDVLFSRLTTQSSATPSSTTGSIAPARPDKSLFSFEDRLGATNTEQKKSPKDLEQKKSQKDLEQKKSQKDPEQEKSQKDPEQDYQHKAIEYISALPAGHNTTLQTIQTVSKKLRSSWVPDAKLDTKSNEILKTRYVFAVTSYVKHKGRKAPTADFVNQVLNDGDGNFLHLCATLVEEKYIALDNLDDVTGLCKMILDILPKPEPASTVPATTTASVAPTSAAQEAKAVSNDPVDKMTAWPTQEKRENGKMS